MNLDGTKVSLWTVSLEHPAARSRAFAIKRGLDVVLSLALLVLAAPVLLAAWALVRLTSPGPALFVQGRIGHHGERFDMLKLRTMEDGAETREEELAERRPGRTFFKLVDDPRITRVGRILRRWSIDELPQLMNVLEGTMSLVGPRPLLVSDFRRFPKSRQLRRFAVKPGLTGLWQISGRSLLSDEERMRLDLQYVERWSLWLDLKILVRTVPAVLLGRGAT
ncbi:MAG TPA: sugar transferase [Thermoanaerobaculia bacterium]|nr:sugar transferase [Thermoanaerobaculia bacterium]